MGALVENLNTELDEVSITARYEIVSITDVAKKWWIYKMG